MLLDHGGALKPQLFWNLTKPSRPILQVGWLVKGSSPWGSVKAGISTRTDDTSRKNTKLNMAHKVNITLNVLYSWWERMLYTNTQREQRKRPVLQGLFWGIPAALSQEVRGRKPLPSIHWPEAQG